VTHLDSAHVRYFVFSSLSDADGPTLWGGQTAKHLENQPLANSDTITAE